MTDAVGSIDTSNADSGADAVETTEAVTATETQAPAPSQAEIAAQVAALAAASAAAAAVDAEAVAEGEGEGEAAAKGDDADAKKADDKDDADAKKADDKSDDAAAETRAEVEAIVAEAAGQDMDGDGDDDYYDDDDDDTVSPFLAVGLTALIIGGGLLLLSSNDDSDEDPDININIPPTARDLSVTVAEDATVSGQVTAVDPDSSNVTFSLVGSAPAGLTFNSDGTFTFDASNDAYQDLNDGETQVLTVNFQATDGQAVSNGVLTITVNGVTDNFAPVAVDDTATTAEDTAVTIDVLANDTDADNDDLTVTAASSPNGTVVINDDGTITFTPAANFNGTAVINYTVSDGVATDTGVATVTVTPVVDALDAVDDTYAATEDSGVVTGDVTANDIDVDGGDVTVALAAGSTAPPGFTLNSDGTWSLDTGVAAYQSLAAGETAVYTFDYVLSDADSMNMSPSDTATVTLTVTGVNDAPIANDDTASTLTADPVVIDVLANDTDVDGDDLTVTAASSDNGTVVINDDGTITFTANDGFEGDAIINYTVSDGTATDTGVATVTVTMAPPVISLDVDDDNDTNTPFTLDLDASDDAFDFVDDASVANNVQIINFGADDTITFVVDDPSDVAFASGDYDGDGNADDVQIAINIGGIVSEIILIDAVANGAIVFNESTAEQAIGPGFDNFQFDTGGTAMVAPVLDQTTFLA